MVKHKRRSTVVEGVDESGNAHSICFIVVSLKTLATTYPFIGARVEGECRRVGDALVRKESSV